MVFFRHMCMNAIVYQFNLQPSLNGLFWESYLWHLRVLLFVNPPAVKPLPASPAVKPPPAEVARKRHCIILHPNALRTFVFRLGLSHQVTRDLAASLLLPVVVQFRG